MIPVVVLLLLVAPFAVAGGPKLGPKMSLFNGQNLSGFSTYLERHGKNNDPDHVFSVEKGAVHVSGSEFGYWKDEAGYRDPRNEVEKPHGQWNCLELWALGNTVRYYVNHKLVNEGTASSLTKGRILFQSEGAEVFFKSIEIRPVLPR